MLEKFSSWMNSKRKSMRISSIIALILLQCLSNVRMILNMIRKVSCCKKWIWRMRLLWLWMKSCWINSKNLNVVQFKSKVFWSQILQEFSKTMLFSWRNYTMNSWKEKKWSSIKISITITYQKWKLNSRKWLTDSPISSQSNAKANLSLLYWELKGETSSTWIILDLQWIIMWGIFGMPYRRRLRKNDNAYKEYLVLEYAFTSFVI